MGARRVIAMGFEDQSESPDRRCQWLAYLIGPKGLKLIWNDWRFGAEAASC
jgi:hypothetical protein